MQSEAYRLFTHFWWLIFPIFGMIMGMIRLASRHSQANRTIDIIKSYVNQGKEPPPELLAALCKPDFDTSKSAEAGWVPVFLFAALSVGFVMLGMLQGEWEPKQMAALFFVAIIMGGMSLGFLVTALVRRKRDQDPPR